MGVGPPEGITGDSGVAGGRGGKERSWGKEKRAGELGTSVGPDLDRLRP